MTVLLFNLFVKCFESNYNLQLLQKYTKMLLKQLINIIFSFQEPTVF